ncbi:TPA: SprT-like domain-containing protein [Serratia marcescens]|uniref:SprT-like domain-containing protein n=1 Tax=Serratia marcescens TaxID=615 RepID=UPI0036F79DB2
MERANRATERAYAELQQAYDFYNLRLFGGQLPDCLITFQRGKNTMGYFSRNRFVSPADGTLIDEIALNPEYFPVYPLIEVMQTLVHEQCHMWQFHYGKPSRKGYHNAEWAAKMEAVGLMPSSTGRPGGDKLGQSINDYPIPGGRFQKETLELFRTGFALSWFDRFPVKVEQPKDLTPIIEQWRETLAQALQANPAGVIQQDAAEVERLLTLALVPSVQVTDDGDDSEVAGIVLQPKPKTRHKHVCPECGAAAWGKPGLNILCGECNVAFIDIDN